MTCPILPRYTMCISIKGTFGNVSSSHSILEISNPCLFNYKDARKPLLKLIVPQDFQQKNLTFCAMCDIIFLLSQYVTRISFCVLCCINYSTDSLGLTEHSHDVVNALLIHF